MEMKTIIGAFAGAALFVTSCTGLIVYKGGQAIYGAVEDNTEWGIKGQALTQIFTDNAYGDYSDEHSVSYLKSHGWSDGEANKFPACFDKFIVATALTDDNKVQLVKGCMENGL